MRTALAGWLASFSAQMLRKMCTIRRHKNSFAPAMSVSLRDMAMAVMVPTILKKVWSIASSAPFVVATRVVRGGREKQRQWIKSRRHLPASGLLLCVSPFATSVQQRKKAGLHSHGRGSTLPKNRPVSFWATNCEAPILCDISMIADRDLSSVDSCRVSWEV